MDYSIDRSLLSDDDRPYSNKIKRGKKIFLGLIIASLVLLIFTFIFAAIPSASQKVIDENNNLKEANTQLKQRKNQLNQDLTAIKELNSNLTQTKTSLEAQLNLNNDLIVFLQNDIKLNCNPLKQRLRFNGTNMNAFSLQIQNANSVDTPEIIFLNVSDNQLTSFCDNSLPSVEYIELNNNPISKISNNKLDKIQSVLIVTNQPKLVQFSSNFLPILKKLTLKNNVITVFKDNTLNNIRFLDLSSNILGTFSNFNYSNLQNLDISSNPITQFSGNKFQNLVQITTLFTYPNPIVFNDNFFGKANSLFIRYKESNQKVSLTFANNYFPYLTNLSFGYLKINQIFLANNMAALAHLKFYFCQFNKQYQSPELYRNFISLEFHGNSFDNFTNLTYPNLTVLIVNQTIIRQFSKNTLTELRCLILDNDLNSSKGNLQNNSIPNLKTLYLRSFYIKNPNFIKSIASIQQIQLKNNDNINSFGNYVLPHLTTLYLEFNGILSFQNNSFPSLTNLTIKESNCTINIVPFIEKLQYLYIYDNIINLNFPKLKFLRVQFSSFKFTNNILPQLQDLFVQGGVNIESNDMPLIKSITMINSQINTFPTKFDEKLQFLGILDILSSKLTSFDSHTMPNLQTILIISSKMSSFNKNYLPKVTKIYMYDNNLTFFDCDGLRLAKQINLTKNILNDSTVDKIISCKLSNLTILDLSKNNISNPNQAKNRLSNAYPNALIVV